MSWIPGMCVACGAENRRVNDDEICYPCFEAGHAAPKLIPECGRCGTPIVGEELSEGLCLICQVQQDDKNERDAKDRQARIEATLA